MDIGMWCVFCHGSWLCPGMLREAVSHQRAPRVDVRGHEAGGSRSRSAGRAEALTAQPRASGKGTAVGLKHRAGPSTEQHRPTGEQEF